MGVAPGGSGTYIGGLTFATALAWAPDGRLFIAERGGVVNVAAGTQVSTFATVSTVTTERGGGYSERGLLGVAVSPTFITDRWVYAMYSTADYQHTVVERWADCGGRATGGSVIIVLPAGQDCCHKGGRLEFGPDGKLYVTLGDEHSVPAGGGQGVPVPQDTSDPRGKVLRYNPDGTIPADNPFGAASPVWVAGLRNPFGLAFGPGGQVLVTANGPSGDAGAPSTGYDIATLVRAGAVLQWPECYGYSHPLVAASGCGGRPPPDWSSEKTTVVPTGAVFVDSHGPASLRNHFVFCTYATGMLVFSAGSPHATVAAGPQACRLDVAQGPDHAVYFSEGTAIDRLAP